MMSWTRYLQCLNFSSYIFVTYTCKHPVFNYFFCINCYILIFAFTNCSKIRSFWHTLNRGCKCSKKFIVALIKAHHFCSYDTNCNFYCCYWLHQMSYIFFWFICQPRIICLIEITKFVMCTLKQLYDCILAAYVWTSFECLLPRNESSHFSWLIPWSTFDRIS